MVAILPVLEFVTSVFIRLFRPHPENALGREGWSNLLEAWISPLRVSFKIFFDHSQRMRLHAGGERIIARLRNDYTFESFLKRVLTTSRDRVWTRGVILSSRGFNFTSESFFQDFVRPQTENALERGGREDHCEAQKWLHVWKFLEPRFDHIQRPRLDAMGERILRNHRFGRFLDASEMIK